MDAIVASLREILINAIPTLLIVILLHIYLKKMFFQPMAYVLKKRYDATEGARESADQSLKHAASKAEAYESALQSARLQIYRLHDEHRTRRQAEQAVALQEARARAQELIDAAKSQIAEETKAAAHELLPQSEVMAEQLAERLLHGRAA